MLQTFIRENPFPAFPGSGIPIRTLNRKRLASKMLSLALDDLEQQSEKKDMDDMFGFAKPDDLVRKDAIIWLYSLNPEGSDIPFEWVCDELGHDPEIFRRVIARNMPEIIKETIRMLAYLVDDQTIRDMVHTMSEYLNLDDWESKREVPCFVLDIRQ